MTHVQWMVRFEIAGLIAGIVILIITHFWAHEAGYKVAKRRPHLHVWQDCEDCARMYQRGVNEQKNAQVQDAMPMNVLREQLAQAHKDNEWMNMKLGCYEKLLEALRVEVKL